MNYHFSNTLTYWGFILFINSIVVCVISYSNTASLLLIHISKTFNELKYTKLNNRRGKECKWDSQRFVKLYFLGWQRDTETHTADNKKTKRGSCVFDVYRMYYFQHQKGWNRFGWMVTCESMHGHISKMYFGFERVCMTRLNFLIIMGHNLSTHEQLYACIA